jgi:hypothetical protein
MWVLGFSRWNTSSNTNNSHRSLGHLYVSWLYKTGHSVSGAQKNFSLPALPMPQLQLFLQRRHRGLSYAWTPTTDLFPFLLICFRRERQFFIGWSIDASTWLGAEIFWELGIAHNGWHLCLDLLSPLWALQKWYIVANLRAPLEIGIACLLN